MANYKHIAHDILSEAHPAPLAASIFVDKVLHKPLHLRPTSPDPTSQDARAKRRIQRLRKKKKVQRGQKVKPLSAKEKRDSGIYDIPDSAKKYEIYVPLHRMWVGYMWEILGMKKDEKAFVTGNSAGSKLASADYHGAEVTVVRSRCVGMVGLAGIVVKDTKFTFQIITEKNELKSKTQQSATNCLRLSVLTVLAVPKRYTIFRFTIPQACSTPSPNEELGAEEVMKDESSLVFELHGSQFETRAPERATKKCKWKRMNEL